MLQFSQTLSLLVENWWLTPILHVDDHGFRFLSFLFLNLQMVNKSIEYLWVLCFVSSRKKYRLISYLLGRIIF